MLTAVILAIAVLGYALKDVIARGVDILIYEICKD